MMPLSSLSIHHLDMLHDNNLLGCRASVVIGKGGSSGILFICLLLVLVYLLF